MTCKSVERKIFTVYNKNGFAFKFDENQGYSWRYGVDFGEFLGMAGQFENWSNDKLNYSRVEVLHENEGVIATFTQADVCNFDGKDFLNGDVTNDRE